MDFYAESGVPFSFTIELPDFGEYGFLLPPADIPVVSIIVIVVKPTSGFDQPFSTDLRWNRRGLEENVRDAHRRIWRSD